MRIVILSAFPDESAKIISNFSNLKEKMISTCRCMVSQWGHHEIILSHTGIGTIASAITTTTLCEKLEPDFIIFCGVAGGLKPEQQRIGDLVLASKVVDADLHLLPNILKETPYKNALINPHTGHPVAVEYTPHESVLDVISGFSFERCDSGSIVTSNTFPAPQSLFAEIKKLDCRAIEMESSGIYGAAARYNVPVLTIRAISNLLDEAGHDLGTQPRALEICAERLAQCLTAILENIPSVEALADSKQQKQIEALIDEHELKQHPEGGWYCQLFCSESLVKAEHDALARYAGEPRTAGTSILYLLPQGDFSGWHTVQSDETWSFHGGEDLLLRIIDPKNGELNEVILGTEHRNLQHTVKAGHVFCAEPLGRYSLTGCVVTPGFDFKDFKLLTREEFETTYPQYSEFAHLARDKVTLDSMFFECTHGASGESSNHLRLF